MPRLWTHPQLEIIPIDLWSTSAEGLWAWSQGFCDQVRATCDGPHVVMGYSLGGRLALHALLTSPALWAGGIVISTDPGLTDPQARAACLLRDRTWGQRFLSEPWTALLAEWDALPVFQGQVNVIPRRESDFSRVAIARLFETFSKGHQAPLTERLRAPMPPLLWITGALDQRYRTIGEQLAYDCPHIQTVCLAGVAHRVPWENSTAFEQTVEAFLSRLVPESISECPQGSRQPAPLDVRRSRPQGKLD